MRKLGAAVQFVLDQFYYTRRWVLDAMAFLSIRLYGAEATWWDVRAGHYDFCPHVDRDLSGAGDLAGLLAAAQESLKTAEARRAGIIDKCKTLLTLSSLLLAVASALLPKSFAFGRLWMQVAFYVAALALFDAIILLLVFFDVRATTRLSLEQSRVELSSEDLKKSLINDYLRCQVVADGQTDYLVELYRAIRFFFLSAFTIIALLFSCSFFQTKPEDQAKAVARELQSTQTFLDLVRGAKGDPGPPGPKGDSGRSVAPALPTP